MDLRGALESRQKPGTLCMSVSVPMSRSISNYNCDKLIKRKTYTYISARKIERDAQAYVFEVGEGDMPM